MKEDGTKRKTANEWLKTRETGEKKELRKGGSDRHRRDRGGLEKPKFHTKRKRNDPSEKSYTYRHLGGVIIRTALPS